VTAIAVGIDDHNGWAIYVCIALEPRLRVVQKGRFELIDETCHAQPYHHESLDLGLAEGDRLVRQTTDVARQCAQLGLGHVAEEVTEDGECTVIAIRHPPLVEWPLPLADVHASRETLAEADAMLYHRAISESASGQGLRVCHFSREDVVEKAAVALGMTTDALAEELQSQAKVFGPPWRHDQLLAAGGAIVALVG
jgi:hypothetical protein